MVYRRSEGFYAGKRNGIRPETLRFRRRNADIRQPGDIAGNHSYENGRSHQTVPRIPSRPSVPGIQATGHEGLLVFAYDQSEALHLSHREKQTIVRCMDDLGEETGHSADTHSDSLLSGLLECLLDYCMRYYERQFITRGPANEQLMRQYESVLDGYIRAGKLRTRGFPTAEYCSQRLGLSSAYFSDMVEHETGKRPETYVELKRMQIARQRLLDHESARPCDRRGAGFRPRNSFARCSKDHRPDARPLSDVR